MFGRIKVEYMTPYGEEYGVCGYVWAEAHRGWLYISRQQDKRAERNLRIGGVSPLYILPDGGKYCGVWVCETPTSCGYQAAST